MIAVMGPEAAVNAVYFNKIQEKPEAERAAYVAAAARRVPRDIDISSSPASSSSTRSSPARSCADELARRLELYSRSFHASRRAQARRLARVSGEARHVSSPGLARSL